METHTKQRIKGHLAASFSTLIWGFTFISTKVLLKDFSPVEILFFRFALAYFMLLAFSPKIIKPKKNKGELLYALAGLCSVTLFFLLQNIGLMYTLASNAGVIVAVAPMLTAIVSYFMIKQNNLNRNFVIGFFITISGVSIISFNGNFVLQLNPLGDILIILGALSWAFYCNILVLIDNKDLSLIQHTRKVFFYGLLFMIPVLYFTNFQLAPERFLQGSNLFNMLFLAFGASALSFLTWNFAVGTLGPVKTVTYIYLNPIVTIIASILVLHEPFTLISLAGTLLILIGLMVSEGRILKRKWPGGEKEVTDEEVTDEEATDEEVTDEEVTGEEVAGETDELIQ